MSVIYWTDFIGVCFTGDGLASENYLYYLKQKKLKYMYLNILKHTTFAIVSGYRDSLSMEAKSNLWGFYV